MLPGARLKMANMNIEFYKTLRHHLKPVKDVIIIIGVWFCCFDKAYHLKQMGS